MKTETKLTIITLLLLILWVPVEVDKLYSFGEFKAGMLRQPLPNWLSQQLIWLLPWAEGAVVIGLLTGQRLRHRAFVLSFCLMLAFTAYIGLALAGYWDKVPCACGSVIRFLTWKQHFFFNLFYVFVSGWGVLLSSKLQHPPSLGEAERMGGPTRLAADK